MPKNVRVQDSETPRTCGGSFKHKTNKKQPVPTPQLEYFTFDKQDHTLGNLLMCSLQQDPERIKVAMYRQPRPLEATIEFHIKRTQVTGETTREVMAQHCQRLKTELTLLEKHLRLELQRLQNVPDNSSRT